MSNLKEFLLNWLGLVIAVTGLISVFATIFLIIGLAFAFHPVFGGAAYLIAGCGAGAAMITFTDPTPYG
jgi:hypothetical protein